MIGLLPGLGGAMADWLAYGATVATIFGKALGPIFDRTPNSVALTEKIPPKWNQGTGCS